MRSLSLAAIALLLTDVPAQCTAWQPGSPVPGVNGQVWISAAWDPDGPGPLGERIVVGGDFTVAGRTTARSIAAFDPVAGTWSALGSGMNGDVRSLLALPNGDLIAGGYFTTAGGTSARRVARWDGTAWSAMGNGFGGGGVVELAPLPGGEVAARIALQYSPTGIMRWNGSSWASLGYLPDATAMAAMPNGDLAVGFWSPQTNSATVELWNGSAWTPYGASLAEQIEDMAVDGSGELVVRSSWNMIRQWTGSLWAPIGAFNEAAAVTVMPNGDIVAAAKTQFWAPVSMFRFEPTTWVWLPLGGPAGFFNTLAPMRNGSLIVGGRMAYDGGVSVTLWNGSTWSSLDRGWNGSVEALEVLPNGNLVAGGAFSTADGTSAPCLAGFDGASWSSVGGGTGNTVTALDLTPTGALLVGGFFTAQGPTGTDSVGLWDGTNWQPLGAGLGVYVGAVLALANGDFVVGGSFALAPNSPSVARWDGSSWQPLGAGLPYRVNALAELPAGQIAAGGPGGVSIWNGTTWVPTGLTTPVHDLLLAGGDLYAAGNEVSVLRNGVWTSLGGAAPPPVRAMIELPNGDLLAGGYFTSIGGVQANRLARFDGSAWSAVGQGMDGAVHVLRQLDSGDVIAGGPFTTVDGAVSANFARLASLCPATSTPYGAACAGTAGTMLLEVARRPWAGSTFESACSGFAPGALALSVVGFATASTPLSSYHGSAVPGCNLLATDDAVLFVTPGAGAATLRFPIPFDPAVAGVTMHHQFLQLETAIGLRLLGSNGVSLTVGYF